MKPYFEAPGVVLYHGDCLEVLPTFEDGSIDGALTDIPYGTTACSWDSVIPLDAMWAQARRLLRKRGVFITTAAQPFTSALIMSNIEWFRQELIWRKPMGTNYLNANRAPMKNHENIIVFCEANPYYNPQMREGRAYRATRGAVGDYIRDKTVNGYITENKGLRYPLSVINFGTDSDSEHPTQKPLALYKYLMLTYTQESETILDFCAGSGTTGVAAIQLGRRAVLIEREEHYCEIAARRLAAALQQPPLFIPGAPLKPPEPAQLSMLDADTNNE